MKTITVASDNTLTDWAFSSKRGDAAMYYEYQIEGRGPKTELLCRARGDKSRGRGVPNEIEALANKAWSLYSQGIVSLVQRRIGNQC